MFTSWQQRLLWPRTWPAGRGIVTPRLWYHWVNYSCFNRTNLQTATSRKTLGGGFRGRLEVRQMQRENDPAALSASISSRGQGHWQHQATESSSIVSQPSPFLLAFITSSHQNPSALLPTPCDPQTTSMCFLTHSTASPAFSVASLPSILSANRIMLWLKHSQPAQQQSVNPRILFSLLQGTSFLLSC